MPDLGIYALEVTVAYLGSFLLLAGIIALTWMQSRRVSKQLDEAEGRKDG